MFRICVFFNLNKLIVLPKFVKRSTVVKVTFGILFQYSLGLSTYMYIFWKRFLSIYSMQCESLFQKMIFQINISMYEKKRKNSTGQPSFQYIFFCWFIWNIFHLACAVDRFVYLIGFWKKKTFEAISCLLLLINCVPIAVII